MWFLFILTMISMFLQICFVTLAIAAGLYYLAELVEEYTVISGKVIRVIILANLGIQLGLWLFESFPVSLIVCSVVHHLANLSMHKSFPYFVLLSPSFLVSLVTLVINHYLAFSYFATKYYPITEVLGYFTICVWAVPFAFFVSLSANEYVLPTTSETHPTLQENDDLVSHYFSRNKKKYGLLYLFNYLKDTVWPYRNKKF